MRKKKELYDFKAFGQAIKEARNKRELTREQAAALIPIDPRYLTNIENKGKHPSLPVFHKIITLFNISVDQYFYPDAEPNKSTRRRHLDELLDNLDEKDLIIVEATASGIFQARDVEDV